MEEHNISKSKKPSLFKLRMLNNDGGISISLNFIVLIKVWDSVAQDGDLTCLG